MLTACYCPTVSLPARSKLRENYLKIFNNNNEGIQGRNTVQIFPALTSYGLLNNVQNICTLCRVCECICMSYDRACLYCHLSSSHTALTIQATSVCAETYLSWRSFYEPVGVSDCTMFHPKSTDEWWILNNLEGNDRELIDLLFMNFSGRNRENHLLSQSRQQLNLLNSEGRLSDAGTKLNFCINQFGSDWVNWRSKT
jgi:hypothetical protein